MKKLLILATCFFTSSVFAQTDLKLYEIIESVSEERIKQYVKTLTDFGTRHTLSDKISRYAKEWIKEKGDDTPVSWQKRSEGLAEKLAKLEVTVADSSGDVDPIKAAN